jgi:hypothetical protein
MARSVGISCSVSRVHESSARPGASRSGAVRSRTSIRKCGRATQVGPIQKSRGPRMYAASARRRNARNQLSDRASGWRSLKRKGPVGRLGSALDVGELLGHLAVEDAEDVNAADIPRFSGPVYSPAVEPADDAAVPRREGFLGLEHHIGS